MGWCRKEKKSSLYLMACLFFSGRRAEGWRPSAAVASQQGEFIPEGTPSCVIVVQPGPGQGELLVLVWSDAQHSLVSGAQPSPGRCRTCPGWAYPGRHVSLRWVCNRSVAAGAPGSSLVSPHSSGNGPSAVYQPFGGGTGSVSGWQTTAPPESANVPIMKTLQ